MPGRDLATHIPRNTHCDARRLLTRSYNTFCNRQVFTPVMCGAIGIYRRISYLGTSLAKPSQGPTSAPSLSSTNPSSPPSGSQSSGTSLLSSALWAGSVPTAAPSMSLGPMSTPSSAPSDAPSSRPSSAPTVSLAHLPSLVPSDVPSNTPSSDPSSLPSKSPSLTPSAAPRDVPSKSPSTLPSVLPSLVPSGLSSDVPDWLGSACGNKSKHTVLPSVGQANTMLNDEQREEVAIDFYRASCQEFARWNCRPSGGRRQNERRDKADTHVHTNAKLERINTFASRSG